MKSFSAIAISGILLCGCIPDPSYYQQDSMVVHSSGYTHATPAYSENYIVTQAPPRPAPSYGYSQGMPQPQAGPYSSSAGVSH